MNSNDDSTFLVIVALCIITAAVIAYVSFAPDPFRQTAQFNTHILNKTTTEAQRAEIIKRIQ